MDLGAWNERLAEHFGALARDRKDNNIPLFALEHGLARAERAALQEKVREHIRVSPPDPRHELVWTVYAAELGYRYAGNEYWDTFKNHTPGWTERDRGWIRDAFIAFRKRFSGAEPSGAWAKQFSIICWPITHAILPYDLQQQLARVLYELRHSFSAELFESPLLLGQFIAAQSWNAPARFQNLVQEPALVGQIAAALLLQGKEGFNPLLHPMTLRRIGDDVDRGRCGREWLQSARHAAEERAKIRGLALRGPTTTLIQRREEARAEVEKLGIEPRLVLRPMGGACWEVSLEIPDLSHLLLRFPQVRDVITSSRCTVAGAAGRPLARGRCLHGPQRVALKRWPRPDDVLLKFERAEPLLEYLLRAECLLRPGTSWLFKIARDDLAYESRGMRVRAGSRYLLVSAEPLERSDLAPPVKLACEGVHAVSLDVPLVLTSEWEQALRQLQVTQAKSIEVWPAGLAAVAWDGEGYGEWLASETPTLAVGSDHAIDELTVAMSGGGPSLSLMLAGTPLGEPIFIELPQLPVGLHKFSFAARGGRGVESKVIGDLDVVMRVREAHPWSPGVTPRGPLQVELDPAAPSLEELWEGKVDLAIRGPAGRQVRCWVRMFTRAGKKVPSFERQLPPVTLPLSNEEWMRHFERHLKKDKDAQRAYDDANVCEVEFSADELGVFMLRCEREFTPLRWSVRRDSAGFIARLHDDAGSGAPVIEHFSFERPTVGEKLSTNAEQRAPHGGGLYVATLDQFKAAMVVPPIVSRLEDLECEPQIDLPQPTPQSIARLLSFARLWGDARLSGDIMSGLRRRSVVRALADQICARLGGEDWGRAEREFRARPQLHHLRIAIRPKCSPRVSPERLIFPDDGLKKLSAASLHERGTAFVEVIKALQQSHASNEGVGSRDSSGDACRTWGPIWLAEFTLRVASDPTRLCAWAGDDVDAGLARLLDEPVLVRVARFLVLAVDQLHRSGGGSEFSEFYAGWGWSA